MKPLVPEYDPLEWAQKPFAERARMACETYAVQGWGSPSAVYLFYGLKLVLYVGGWWLFCSFTRGMGDLGTIDSWGFSVVAFEKAVLWSLLFEGLGLGCGSGPLTARYVPPFTAFLHFLRPGTIKRPFDARLPVLGGYRRTWLDVGLYAAAQVLLLSALVSGTPARGLLLAISLLYLVLALADKTIFLSARGEHYWTALTLFALFSHWLPGAKALWIALWFWAGFSKLTPHFTSVICVMNSNAPFTAPIARVRRRFYRNFPDDLRPGRFADIAHGGAALEFGIPIVMLVAHGGTLTKVGLAMMVFLHCFISAQVPAGVPLEWNVMMIYGGFFLFSRHAHTTIFDMPPACGVFLAVMLVAIPLLGNLFPKRISFLMAMRYYAGNWPYSVWLFRGESYRKLDAIKKAAAWVPDQLARFYDRPTAVAVASRTVGWRLMHLQGRAMGDLVPMAVDRFEDYTWVDGELVCGMILGYNFGDGHLHDEELLAAIQEECGFEDGELRVMMVEAQPFGRHTCNYRVHDACTGLMAEGELDVRVLQSRQAWERSSVDGRAGLAAVDVTH
ncbi:MAG: DUF3556 domain-containing protein, partial [Hyalangium sp.]|uniref:DUF3556 domain-containing protein n=1 Tax=Hyalangium sp. TaxID=2028555 RepID=UPI003899EE1E